MATKTVNTVLNLKDQFSNKFKQTANLTKQQTRQMKLLNNNITQFKQTAVSGFTEAAKSAIGFGAAFIGVNAAIDKVKDGVNFVKEYQSSMANLQAATGATTEEMNQMKSQLTDLYKQNMGESWSDLANSMLEVKQTTGQTGEQLKQTTALAVTYRDTFGEEIADSIKAADTMTKQFGISSTQAYNLLAQGAQKGLNKSNELLDTSNEYSLYFKNLGFSAGEMFDIFGAGLDAGAYNLDKIGDSVKEFEIRSKDMSKTSLDAFKTLNMDGVKMSQTFAAGGEGAKSAFKEVTTAIGSIEDPVKRNSILVSLFGTQAEDMGQEVILALGNAQDKFKSTIETIKEINKIKYNDVSQAVSGIGRLFETSVLIPIANKLLPKLSEFGQWFNDNTPKIESGIDKAFGAGSQIIDKFSDAIGFVKDNASWLVPVIGGLTAAIIAQQSIGPIISLYSTWKTITKEVTIAQAALNIVMNLNPFGMIALAIGAVVAAGIYLWKNWDTVSAKASEIWKSIKSSFASGVNTVIDKINLLIEKLNVIPGVNIPVIAKMKTEEDSTNSYKSGTAQILTPNSIDKISQPTIPKFATGTSYFSGGLAQINERGGEIVNLPNGSQVIPADKSEKMISSGKPNIVVNFTIQGNVVGNQQFIDEVGSVVTEKVVFALGNM